MKNNLEHPRSKLRKAVVARLKQSVTSAKQNVFDSRSKPLFEHHFPALLVYIREERIAENQYDGDGYFPSKRELELSIEGIVTSCSDLDDKIDLLALEIEQSLLHFEVPDFLNSTIKLKSTEADVVIEGAKCFGAVRLNYLLTYYTPTLKNEENQ